MGADTPQDSRQRQALHDELHRFLVLAHFDELDVALDIDLGRAGQGAGSPVELFNGIGGGHGLGKMPVGCGAGAQTFVEG